MNTIEPMVLRSPLGWEPLPPQPRRRWVVIAAPIVLATALLLASFNVLLPYYAIAPGSATQVNDLISVADGQGFPSDGKFLLTTVSLGQVRAIDAFLGWIDPDVDIVEEERIVPPNTSRREFRQLNLQLMDTSKQTAIVVALRRLGYNVNEKGDGALVVAVFPGLPAEGVLEPGDVITAIDGNPTPVFSTAVSLIRAHRPADRVKLDIARLDGSTRTVEIALAANPSDAASAVLGVELRTHNQQFEDDAPVDVDIKSGRIGGPSAGLAFTLGVLDALTPGELTGGKRVAVTGTINLDGTVGEVGGVAQKTAAVRRSGATVFLVPEGEFKAASARAGSKVKVVKVRTLQEALDALGSLGGDLSALGSPAGRLSG